MPLNKLGLVKTTLIDFPGHVAATVFTSGCNMRCPYCHNPELCHTAAPPDALLREDISRFLKKRRAVLEGVCISGGEPLIHADLTELIAEIRSLSLKVKIDTNGTLPQVLKKLDVDFIAMDVKSSLGKYHRLGFKGDTGTIRESIRWIKASGIPHQFRSTAAPGLFAEEDLPEIADLLLGCQEYVINPYRGGNTLDPAYAPTPYTARRLGTFAAYMRSRGIPCRVNNAHRKQTN